MLNRLFPILLAVLVLFGASTVVYAQDDTETPTEAVEGPADAVRDYMDAWVKGDAEAAAEVIHPDDSDMAGFALGLAFAFIQLEKYDIGDVTMIDDTHATVAALAYGKAMGMEYVAVEVHDLESVDGAWFLRMNTEEEDADPELGPDGEPLDETDLHKADRERMGTPEGTVELFFELWAAYDGHKASNVFTGFSMARGNELSELFFYYRDFVVEKLVAEVDEDAGTATVTVVFSEVEVVEEILSYEEIELMIDEDDGLWKIVDADAGAPTDLEIDTEGQDTAEAAITKFMQAWVDKDQNAFLSCVEESGRAEMEDSIAMMFGMIDVKSFEVSSVEVDGDTAIAVVSVEMSAFGEIQEDENEIELVKVDGVWYVVPEN